MPDLYFGDTKLVYIAKENKIGMVCDQYPVLQFDHADTLPFLQWLHEKGQSQSFMEMEIMYWPREDAYVICVNTPQAMFCCMCVKADTWDQFLDTLETDYQRILENVYQPLMDIQQQYGCTWVEAVDKFLAGKEREIKEREFRIAPDLPI